ncbi:adhesion G protein-coupled receptor E1-like [Montipora capricornis]|uniref:adhesion G protein-coupled receptor E1-like n=1 Tax=Montipora capricornis TaxID=246305 RepID=UPI0035F1E983
MEDTKECKLDGKKCGHNSFCFKNEGSYRCKCKTGFKSANGDGKDCADLNECETGEVCGEVAKCENTIGSYKCSCTSKGFKYDAKRKGCFDIDECTDPNTCGPHSRCLNQPATYVCSCKDGFESKDKERLNCTDINECLRNAHKCDVNAFCVNNFGSYACKCKTGFAKNSHGICEEVCYGGCPENSECRNGRCHCLPGYAIGPYRGCYEQELLFIEENSGMALHPCVILPLTGLLTSFTSL